MAAPTQVWNIPNRISMARLVLSFGVFVLVPLQFYWAAFWIFVVAAGSDWIDGWYARKYDQVTQLGRILDPFCDKILICGLFILLAVEMYARFPWYATIAGWMAVVVTGRELLVTVLRSLIEGSGGDFSAKMPGKIKMWLQCIAGGAALVALALNKERMTPELPSWFLVGFVIAIWGSVFSTIHSGALYVIAAKDQLIGGTD